MHEHQAHGNDRDYKFMVGLDVGSTTVKAVVINAATDEILWRATSASAAITRACF